MKQNGVVRILGFSDLFDCRGMSKRQGKRSCHMKSQLGRWGPLFSIDDGVAL